MQKLNKVAGCLIGGAAGDALGYPIEFESISSIECKYGDCGVTSYDKFTHGTAVVSDDTQMTMYTANGLINCLIKEGNKHKISVETWCKYVHEAYKEWYKTQTEKFKEDKYNCWITHDNSLWVNRAPGNTCLSALKDNTPRSIEEPLNNSKGCGGVMRVAPVGIVCNIQHLDVDEAYILGTEVGAITHGNIDGYVPAGILSVIVYKLLQDNCSILKAVEESIRISEILDNNTKTLNLVKQAIDLACNSSHKSITDIEKLGYGWTGDEAIAISIYCALRYSDDFEKAMVISVNHSGDSDSTGAITGNILGTRIGLSNIPSKFVENLEFTDKLKRLADIMCAYNQ